MPIDLLLGKGFRFTVWAPEKKQMVLHVVAPFNKEFLMHKNDRGYFLIDVITAETALRYFFRPDGDKGVPDPASQFQPEGVHGPSQTIHHESYTWKDKNWKGLALNELIFYELHVGTFTPEGNFEAIIPRLDDLQTLGVNALELMPVAQFPGNRNWGYDGVFPYAVQNSYGGPDGLKKLVDACHERGIAVFLDVVYNHLGPEGNYLPQFGPYFTPSYCTPWGDAINYDGEWSDGVRDFFSDNVLYWFKNFHVDGLRCDAIHAVFDNGAVHFWELVHNKVKHFEEQTGRTCHLIAESDLNSPKVVKPPELGGYGFDAQWLDDFHHALYVLLNPADQQRYYDFGAIEQLAKAYSDGFVHSGGWVKFRKRKHGASSAGIAGEKFVVFNLNHDQVGNRAGGERLCMLVDFEKIKIAAAAIMLSPYLPLLFMGEEYADDTPFFYFVSHSDEELIKAVQKGRREEFKDFGFDVKIPDPQDEKTFQQSKVHWEKRKKKEHQVIWQWHQELIKMRKSLQPLKKFQKKDVEVQVIDPSSFALIRKAADSPEGLLCLFNFSDKEVAYTISSTAANLTKILDSKERRWLKPPDENALVHPASLSANGSVVLLPSSVVVYAF